MLMKKSAFQKLIQLKIIYEENDILLDKRLEQSDKLQNMIRVIKRSSNNDEEYPEETSNGNDLIVSRENYINYKN